MSYLKNGHHYIYAEYNPVWCYMGWWLYAAPIVKAPRMPRPVAKQSASGAQGPSLAC